MFIVKLTLEDCVQSREHALGRYRSTVYGWRNGARGSPSRGSQLNRDDIQTALNLLLLAAHHKVCWS